jgi:hypothetical protein
MCGLSSLLCVAIYYLCYLTSRTALVAFLGGLCAWFFGTVGLSVRPLLLGHLFLVLELILLEQGLRNRRRLWLLAPLFAVWVNCHGSYFFGIGLLFVYWICSYIEGSWGVLESKAVDAPGRKTIGVIVLLSVGALCCNPVGFRLLLYPLDTLFHQSTGLKASQVWLPPELLEARTLAMLLAMFAVPTVALLWRLKLQLRDLLFALMSFGMAIQHVRMIFLFGIVVSPILCRLIGPFLEERQKKQFPAFNALLVAACVAVIVAAFPSRAALEQQVIKGNPVGAVEYVRKAQLTGPMLNDYGFGGYLIWALPEHKVFNDGRGDVYDWTGIFAAYGRWALLSEDPQLLLDRHGIRFCILSANAPMARVMTYLPGWRRVFGDDIAVVFAR